MELRKEFFRRPVELVAKELLGKILVRKINKKVLRAKIVETEAYFGTEDPASWARFGKRKDNEAMWCEGGTILIKNVHKYKMLNFVTGIEGEPQAVLIRALEPLNFEGRCSGPGLLTECLKIEKEEFAGKDIFLLKDLWIEEYKGNVEIENGKRIGVVKDLDGNYRFFIKGNKFVSR
ncbi:MAG: DNA-3-methyladenine glycosylase [Nanoarchaeota archaeon]|nr:DNA-3-methyladenine glycosylase [Nanoarchaeota archaeon]